MDHSRHFERAPAASALDSTSDISLHRGECRKGPTDMARQRRKHRDVAKPDSILVY
jgi:hypothetical protein